LTQLQSDEKHNPIINKINTKSFANFWMGMFFMVSTAALIIVMSMFVFVWQPIWTEGFKDFHTISNAIDKLDKTAKPASDAIPLMLVEMTKMQNTMRDMNDSMRHIEEMTPHVKQMTMVLSTEMPRITYMLGRVENKVPNMDFMPFN
jgi:hypothetical protein